MSDRSSSPEPLDPREELARMMSPNFEDSDIPSGITFSLLPTGTLQSSRTNATLRARRVATRFSLGPYGRELQSFATEEPANRTLLLYAKLLAVEQKVSKIVVSSGAFTVSKALLDNIKNYTHAVLLSPKLSTYKSDITWKRVMAVVKQLNVNVPANLETDRHVYKIVKEAVTDELTQTRSKIKKAIAFSRQHSQSVYELANGLVENTQCIVTVALCARLALLRKVHAEEGKSGPKYWDHVDGRLKLVVTMSNGCEEKIQQALSSMLAKDRGTYGTKLRSIIQSDSSPNEWQTAVDDVMSAPAATDSSTQEDGEGDD